jgi:nitroimidazol reductase NimA-like FMN-containing flavoprotein (pyridoxamine 5'-phosphate oxidase superfamily)
VYSILDEALVCHVGFTGEEGQPFVIPTIHARVGDTIYIHGAPANRTLGALGGGGRWCVEVTLVDGLVLARSAFHHSMNYRSAVIFGSARVVEDPAEKERALRVITNKIEPGRWQRCRRPDENELRATRVVALEVEEASAKIRTGGPVDDDKDLVLPHWAGVIPLSMERGEPVPDPFLGAEIRHTMAADGGGTRRPG